MIEPGCRRSASLRMSQRTLALQSGTGGCGRIVSLIPSVIFRESMPEQPIVVDTQFDPEDEYRPEPEPEPQPPCWMDGSLRIGIHTSISGGYANALESARKLGCNALQIF